MRTTIWHLVVPCALLSCAAPTKQVVEKPVEAAQVPAAQPEEEELVERQVVEPAEPQYVEGVDRAAQDAFRKGVVAAFRNPPDYATARAAFEEAITRDRAFLEAYFNLGMLYERTGKPEKAIEVYQSALDANPDTLDAQGYIGKVYLALSKRAKDAGDPAKAAEYERKAKTLFDGIIAKDPDNVTANNALALYWLFRGDRDTAEDFVKKVLMVDPRNVVALNTRGLINLMAGKHRIARWVFEEKALKEDPNSVEAWTNLGLTYLKMGQTPEAVASFEKAIALEPDNVPARLNVAAIYLDYLHYQAALTEYEAVLRLVPGNLDALIGAGSCLLGLHRPEEAVQRWEAALKASPGMATLWARVGKVYELTLQRLDRAIQAYENYVRLANPPANDPIRAKLPVLKQIQAQGGMKAPEQEPAGEGGDAPRPAPEASPPGARAPEGFNDGFHRCRILDQEVA